MALAFLALLGAPYIYDISILRVKRRDSEVHFLPPSSGEVRNEWRYNFSPLISLQSTDRDSPAFYIIGFLTINIDTLSGNTFIERNLEFEREE